MKINLTKSAGFSFGVKRALKIASKTSKWAAKAEMLGNSVHNENVVREINKAWIKKLDLLGKVTIKHF